MSAGAERFNPLRRSSSARDPRRTAADDDEARLKLAAPEPSMLV